ERFAEMLDAIRATAAGVPVTVCVGVDLDDPCAAEYAQLVPASDVHMVCAERRRLGAWCNELAMQALFHGHDILAFFGDDHRPRTRGWDARVVDAMRAMGPGLVYCDDGLQGERLPTAPFWHADVIRALGWFYPPVLTHLFADDYWLHLASDLGRRTYLPDVLIEHMHPSAGKADEDESYRESAACFEHDRAAFKAFVRDEHPAVLARVRGAIGA
ncbi:MAG: hypothetical protein KGK07_17435, partial [Chloroflexota bacterium]|nr:hypothetical protein [Chloroflexota bacterium]